MDRRGICDVISFLPPRGVELPEVTAADLGEPSVRTDAHETRSWRYRDARVIVSAPWIVDLALERARSLRPGVAVAFARSDDGVDADVARALAGVEARARLCLIQRDAETEGSWQTLVEQEFRAAVDAAGGVGDDVEVRWLSARSREAAVEWREALDSVASVTSDPGVAAAIEGRLVMRECGCRLSANVRVSERSIIDNTRDGPIVEAGTVLITDTSPYGPSDRSGDRWIYLNSDDARGVRVARGSNFGCCGWYPTPNPNTVCTAHRNLIGWTCSECSSPWFVAYRARDVAFSALAPPGEVDPPDEMMLDGVA